VSELTQRGLSAAIHVARQQGLRFADEPRILRDRGNLLVHLAPAPVVARVATLTGTRRTGDGWLRREVSIAGFLASAGAPVVKPSGELDPGPHTHTGVSLSFWEYVEELETPLDAAEAGRRLRECHETLVSYAGELEPFGTLNEAERWLEELVTEGRIDTEHAATLRAESAEVRSRISALGLPVQAVHGDAHLDNAINTAAGPLWNDWEDTCLAPRALDLGCMQAAACRPLHPSGATTPSRWRRRSPHTGRSMPRRWRCSSRLANFRARCGPCCSTRREREVAVAL
jgi:hypothetical protein